MRRALAFALVFAAACSARSEKSPPAADSEPDQATPAAEPDDDQAPPAEQVDSPPDPAALDLEAERAGRKSFTATLRIDANAEPDGFQGVWLERVDGERWLISYRASDVWKAFEDKRVTALGGLYEPRDPSKDAAHMLLTTLAVDPAEGADPIGVGPEETFHGRLKRVGGAKGASKGDARLLLESGDVRYELYAVEPIEGLEPGAELGIRGRRVERPENVDCAGDAWIWPGRVEPPKRETK